MITREDLIEALINYTSAEDFVGSNHHFDESKNTIAGVLLSLTKILIDIPLKINAYENLNNHHLSDIDLIVAKASMYDSIIIDLYGVMESVTYEKKVETNLSCILSSRRYEIDKEHLRQVRNFIGHNVYLTSNKKYFSFEIKTLNIDEIKGILNNLYVEIDQFLKVAYCQKNNYLTKA